MKRLLSKLDGKIGGEDFRQALLAWRNTPRADGYSPVFAFLGRHLRGRLPDARDPSARLVPEEFEHARDQTNTTTVAGAGGHSLSLLHPGD